MESPCESGIEPPGSISHGVIYIYIIGLRLRYDRGCFRSGLVTISEHCFTGAVELFETLSSGDDFITRNHTCVNTRTKNCHNNESGKSAHVSIRIGQREMGFKHSVHISALITVVDTFFRVLIQQGFHSG